MQNDPPRLRRYKTGNTLLNLQLLRLSHLDLTGRIDNISQNEIAYGGFSDVYQGNLIRKDGTTSPIAIKRARVSLRRNRTFTKSFTKELYIASKLNHENVIKLEGFMIERDYPSLITPWAEGGTLNVYIGSHAECALLPLACRIYNGLAYLHGKGIIHADLKGSNVLMTSRGTPMLADFGLARALIYSNMDLKTSSYGRLKGTSNWMAYELAEVIENPRKQLIYTKESDIWAYGMVLYEMVSKNAPYSHITEEPVIFHIL